MSIEEQFDAAVKVIQSLPKDGFFQPSNEMKLKFYAFFKQATEGPNTTKKPPFYDFISRYKWDAWKKCGEMSRSEAMKLYVEELKKVIETISMTHEVSEFLNVLGPFYEFLPEEVINNNKDQLQDNSNKKKGSNEIDENQVTTTSDDIQNFTSYDSDGDEFADTYDTTPQHHQNKIPTVFHNIFNDVDNREIINCLSTSSQLNFGDNQKSNSESHNGNKLMIQSNQNNIALDFNEQLAVAIFQLQNSIDQITNRIHALETRQVRHEELSKQNRSNHNGSNWPFDELSPKTTIFFLTWPVAVFFLINYLKRFRKK